ncbi:hypothetical protein K458DRAFT_194627 [Lentithecium fluviatile CBS 122367]|uniref:Uncharacterized protein n=1 Tax=Lentithecium fluviatile CBS 122367 TaxID=1168545 RepID=A0A6G1ID06_9PLEO|nr:hypothetical protein K458DRAFT_194627 [Lentithecium fluviatile CBS 122367]
MQRLCNMQFVKVGCSGVDRSTPRRLTPFALALSRAVADDSTPADLNRTIRSYKSEHSDAKGTPMTYLSHILAPQGKFRMNPCLYASFVYGLIGRRDTHLGFGRTTAMLLHADPMTVFLLSKIRNCCLSEGCSLHVSAPRCTSTQMQPALLHSKPPLPRNGGTADK